MCVAWHAVEDRAPRLHGADELARVRGAIPAHERLEERHLRRGEPLQVGKHQPLKEADDVEAPLAEQLVAEGTAPLNYFKDAYNVFDFVLAVAGVATIAESGSQNPIISLARMLRMVQLFKLAHNLPRLQLVTEALVYGVKSMIWVALLLFLFNYLFGLLGLVLFRDNDVRSCLIFVLCCAWIVPRTYLYSTKSNDAHFLSLLLRSSHSRSTLGTSGGRPRRSGASSR